MKAKAATSVTTPNPPTVINKRGAPSWATAEAFALANN